MKLLAIKTLGGPLQSCKISIENSSICLGFEGQTLDYYIYKELGMTVLEIL